MNKLRKSVRTLCRLADRLPSSAQRSPEWREALKYWHELEAEFGKAAVAEEFKRQRALERQT